MKMHLRASAIVALAAVASSIAVGQGRGYGYGFAYASAAYYESAPGLYFSSSSGQYVTYYPSTTGDNWVLSDYYYGNSTAQYSEAVGYSRSNAEPDGTGSSSELITSNWVTVTNEGQTDDTLYVYTYTFGFGSSYAASWNDYAYGSGEATITDSDGQLAQISFGEAETLGFGDGGDLYSWFNYSYGSYGVYYASNAGSFGNIFPFGDYSLAEYRGEYAITLAPGEYDRFYTGAIETHDAYSITPGPIAVTPFVLGLAPVLRRRRRQVPRRNVT